MSKLTLFQSENQQQLSRFCCSQATALRPADSFLLYGVCFLRNNLIVNQGEGITSDVKSVEFLKDGNSPEAHPRGLDLGYRYNHLIKRAPFFAGRQRRS
ncbi:hypothetical protein RRG08_030642 [Elysia crispata]|uniref:Uncharacterized protein n=1 Tax=Elysia crispata TaxID=231223 RepID=A0AAE1D3A7_9GAST|nr:hypothetical protein RRG08_030642 [Elysia crispata]